MTFFLPLLTYLSISIIYIIARYFTTDTLKNRNNKTHSKILTLGYIFFVVLSQFFINLKLTKDLCGTTQIKEAFIYTILPNIFMFGIVFAILNILPGWKTPFANTFGYSVAKIMGIESLLKKMLKTSPLKSSSDKLKKILKYVDNNPSLIINEITPENWNSRMEPNELPSLLKPIYNQDHPEIHRLYNLVSLKNLVSELVWLILVGFLVISTQINALNSLPCNYKNKAKIPEKVKEEKRTYFTRE